MKSILVTGGAGYIGSHTVVELVKAGYNPIILDDFSNANKSLLPAINRLCGRTILVEEGSCTDSTFLNGLFQKYQIQGVIHFAACKAVGESVAQPLKYYNNNLNGLITLLQAMMQHGVSNFVFSSSCTVYGMPDTQTCVSEETPLGKPNSPYGWTKWMAEQIIQDVTVSENLQPVLLRYFNPIGAHESGLIGELPVGTPNNILPYITQTAAGIREKLTVFGNDYPTPDGTCIRDYIHVVDLAIAHVRALEVQGTEKIKIYNLGTGKGTSVLELISAFENATSCTLNWEFGPRRAGDISEIYAEVTKARTELNWSSERSIEVAVVDAWRWEKNRIENGF